MTEEKRRGYNILISDQDAAPGPESSGAEAIAPATPTEPSDNTEVLSINGKVVPFTKSDQGYHIYYLPPAPSLLEAARNFVDTQREIVE